MWKFLTYIAHLFGITVFVQNVHCENVVYEKYSFVHYHIKDTPEHLKISQLKLDIILTFKRKIYIYNK